MDFIGCIVETAGPESIRLGRWAEVIRDHPNLAQPESRQGINPFTKEPMTIRAKPGHADVVVDGIKVGAMKWSSRGTSMIQVFGDAETVGPMALAVADVLGGRYDPDAPLVERHRTHPTTESGAHPPGVGDGERVLPERRVLNEYRVQLQRVPRSEPVTPLESSRNLGLRTKLGGMPDWIQGDRTPKCKKCGERMPFVAQIDSIEHKSENNPVMKEPPERIDFMFADVGMIYVFYCFDCFETSSLLQFY